MLVNLKSLLAEADAAGRAVGSFNAYSRETARGVLAAARRSGSPVALAFGAAYLRNLDFPEIAAEARREAEAADVRFALHLDHCSDAELVRRALDAGFTSIMYDGSALPFAENAANTAAVVRLAEGYGASVEGELGSIGAGGGSAEGAGAGPEALTDPGQAAGFVDATGVDALAVSIGTVHGFYKAAPRIRLDVLEAIRAATPIPLVLHGGSGTPEPILLACMERGIRKINVNTELSRYTVAKLAEEIAAHPAIHLSELSLLQIEFFAEAVAPFIELFSLRRGKGI